MARRIDPVEGRQALRVVSAQGFDVPLTGAIDRAILALAVRFTLGELAGIHPGRSVEVRVPPFGAVQCIDGPTHRRGTPPNVVELDADTWLRLVVGDLTWADAVLSGVVRASGERADLAGCLPMALADQADPADPADQAD